jgi:hypothetical protein
MVPIFLIFLFLFSVFRSFIVVDTLFKLRQKEPPSALYRGSQKHKSNISFVKPGYRLKFSVQIFQYFA